MSSRPGKRVIATAKVRPGRKVGQTSPAIRASSRKNGELGGRPRDRLPQEALDRLGPPPTGDEATANSLRLWNASVLAEVLHLSLKGEVGAELAATARATATALDRALPSRAGGVPDAPNDSEDEDPEDDDPMGPELEQLDDETELVHAG